MAIEYKDAWRGASQAMTDGDGIRATEAQASAMSNNTAYMTPFTTRAAISASIGSLVASSSQGAKADTAIQQIQPGANITIDTTDPLRPIINGQSGGGGGGGGVASVQVSGASGSGLTTSGGPIAAPNGGTITINWAAGFSAYPAADKAKVAALGSLANKSKVAVSDIDAGGTPSVSTYLRGDGFWGALDTGGGVDSIGLSMPAGFQVANSPLTANGTITVTLASGYAMMTTAEKGKLSAIEAGATANSTDAFLRNRANHTGSQAISTVTNLQTTLNGKVSAPTSGNLPASSVSYALTFSKATTSGTPAQAFTLVTNEWSSLYSSIPLRDPRGQFRVGNPSADTSDDESVANAQWVNARFIGKTYGNSSRNAKITLTGPSSSDGGERFRAESLATSNFYAWFGNRGFNMGRLGADKVAFNLFVEGGYDGFQISDPSATNYNFRKYASYYRFWQTGGVQPSLFVQNDGNLVIEYGGSIQWAALGGPSDIKLKEQLTPITDGLEVVRALKPYRFVWKSSHLRDFGLVAQEAQLVVPELVKELKAGDQEPVLGIKYEALIPLLIDAIKTLSNQNETLAARVAALEAGDK